MNKPILTVIGDGGHSRVIRDIIQKLNTYQLGGVLDDKTEDRKEIDGVYYGKLSDYAYLTKKFPEGYFFVAVGDNRVRAKIVNHLAIDHNQYATLIHPSALISPTSEIGPGTVVMPGSIINANTKIGSHCIANSGTIIEHDNHIQDFVHVSPNATLTGGVTIKTGAHIGASATIIPNRTVGEWAIIGAGSVVIHDIESNTKAAGNPARYLSKDKKENCHEKKNIFVTSSHERE
ncbi:acetyltransferase [Metabacillus sp. SLBN-84]